VLLFPLVVYYGTTLGVPLLNGSYRQGGAFWEYFVYVLVMPVALLAPVLLIKYFRQHAQDFS
jgi:hypothetical protein